MVMVMKMEEEEEEKNRVLVVENRVKEKTVQLGLMQTPDTNVDWGSVFLFFFFLIFFSCFCLFRALTNSLATMVVAALLHGDTWTLVKLRPTVFFPCASPHSFTLSSHFPFLTRHQFNPSMSAYWILHYCVLCVRSRIQYTLLLDTIWLSNSAINHQHFHLFSFHCN